jgi:predicted HicB family RNase H-like nuclease
MNKPLSYKNYSANVEFDSDERIFVGHLSGITNIVSFHGESVSELIKAFEAAVDGYITMSEMHGVKPQQPLSGEVFKIAT